MFDFENKNNFYENENLFPTVNPTVMENVDIPLPPEIERFSQSFKLDSLKDIQHELVSPGKPNKRKIGKRISELTFKTRQDLKKKGVLQVTGRKLYVTGGIVRDWLINHFHGMAYPVDDWDLATDASPDALKLIVDAAIEAGQLPPDTTLSQTDKTFGNILLTIGQKQFEITTFPFTGYDQAPRMYLDSLRRNFSPNALYYSVEEKKIFDYHSGITDIYRKTPNFIGKAKKKIKNDKSFLYPLIFARLHSRMSNKGAEAIEKEARAEIRNFTLPEDAPRQPIHDEFVKGIKTSINKEKYLQVLNDLGLLQQVFRGLKVDPNPNLDDMTLFPLVVAQILRPNTINLTHTRDALNALGFSDREIHDIVFLLKLPSFSDENDFKYEKLHTGLSERALDQFIKTTNPRNSEWLKAVIKGTKKPLKAPEIEHPHGLLGHLKHFAHKAHDVADTFKNVAGLSHLPQQTNHLSPHESVVRAAKRLVENKKLTNG